MWVEYFSAHLSRGELKTVSFSQDICPLSIVVVFGVVVVDVVNFSHFHMHLRLQNSLGKFQPNFIHKASLWKRIKICFNKRSYPCTKTLVEKEFWNGSFYPMFSTTSAIKFVFVKLNVFFYRWELQTMYEGLSKSS